MIVVVSPLGVVKSLYDERLDLSAIGRVAIRRASHVEPDDQGRWWADIINGPTLGPFERRSEALTAEVDWIERHRLAVPAQGSNCDGPACG